MSNILERIDKTTIYTQPIFFVIIIITNTLNILILRSRVLRSSPCSYYFLIYSIASIIYTCCLCPFQMLRGLGIPWTSTAIGCRLQNFFLFTFPFLASLALIFASFDRFCSSSASLRMRSISNIRTVKVTIVISTFFCVLYMLPMIAINYYDTVQNLCVQYPVTIVYVYVFSQVIIYHGLVPLCLAILGLLTILNVRKQSNRAAPIIIIPNRNRRTEGQLGRMLFLQVAVHFILSLPYGVTYIMNAFIPSTRTQLIIAIRQISILWLQCDYFVFFFLYILSGSIYRQQLSRLLKLSKHTNEILPIAIAKPIILQMPVKNNN